MAYVAWQPACSLVEEIVFYILKTARDQKFDQEWMYS